MLIKIIDNKVKRLNIDDCEPIDPDQGGLGDFSFATAFSDDLENEFLIIFKLVVNLKENISIDLEYLSRFQTSDAITHEFRESHFTSINAPAIAYPFLRAYLSNLALNSGYEPIMLPTLNFTQIYEDQKKAAARALDS